ncbi:MAG: DUF4868 domain-containing protein, partial [Coriobacteriia bacterium]|nr:DUF4868 domain-containing protein [Coriobacteriia bacterium]
RVVVDVEVQEALTDMMRATVSVMQSWEGSSRPYNPAEKHGSPDYVLLPASDPLAHGPCEIRDANNIPVNQDALADPDLMFAYFARFRDGSDRRVTAVRRATQFKGVVKNRLIRVATDAMKIVHGAVFRLDHDFDYLVDSHSLHILRPTSFEYVHGLKEAVLAAVPGNVAQLATEIPFVDFVDIQTYAQAHSRAARYIASICSGPGCANIDRSALEAQCFHTGVDVVDALGKLCVRPGNEIAFLEVLDRRRYDIELVPNRPEVYRAASRDQI